MVLLDKCNICNRINKPPRTVDFCALMHYCDYYVTCDHEPCYSKTKNKIAEYEINNNIYCEFDLFGKIDNIAIKRTSGKISIGSIKKNFDELRQFITYDKNNNPILGVKWMDIKKDSMFEKTISYKTLSKDNLHLPLIRVKPGKNIDANNLELYNIKNNELYNYCLFTNQATRLILISFYKNKDYFNLLPTEIIQLIFKLYFI